jgi:glycosyltransferase involved in cell wall biosynthesis
MNIVFILPSLERIAPVTVIVNIISFLSISKDIKIQIITLQHTPQNNYKNELLSKGVTIHEYYSIKDAYSSKDEKFWNAVDIVHINSLKPNILAYFLQRRYKHLKSVVTIHSVEKIDYVQSRGLIKGNFSYRLNAFICKRRDMVVAVSADIFAYLKSMNVNNSMLIHNGIDFRKFKEHSVIKTDKSINLVQVGVLNVNKNQFYSLRLLKYLVTEGLAVKLHFLGGVKDKVYQKKLEQYIEDNALENRVIFYGNVGLESLTEILSTKDILLMPSYSEGLPLSPLEGYFYGLPAITSTNGGLKEVNVEGETGIFLNIEDEKSFKKVELFIKEGTYKKISKNVKNYALKNFNAELMGKEYSKLYSKLLC